MKKTLLILSLILMTAASSFAQSSTYKATLKEMIQVSGAEASYKGVVSQMMTMFKKQKSTVPVAFWDELGIELNKIAVEQLVDLVLPIYQKHLTEEDIKGIVAFYKTPVGKKFAEQTPLITQESMAAGQEWGKKIGENMVTYSERNDRAGSANAVLKDL